MEVRLVPKDLKTQESTDFVAPALRIQFGRNLQIARKKAGIMQKDLAKRVGQPGNYISMIENGRAKLTMQQARRLAELVKADVGGLFGLHLDTPQAKDPEGERLQPKGERRWTLVYTVAEKARISIAAENLKDALAKLEKEKGDVLDNIQSVEMEENATEG